ncbi:probable peptide chain release factor C12orf65, mitochondrial isoform X2 [Pomacea canaliculata]|nr:probable peptide chain release factor C12orf65, mitochondrial isoform X2 [Pomacea canaliculata]
MSLLLGSIMVLNRKCTVPVYYQYLRSSPLQNLRNQRQLFLPCNKASRGTHFQKRSVSEKQLNLGNSNSTCCLREEQFRHFCARILSVGTQLLQTTGARGNPTQRHVRFVSRKTYQFPELLKADLEEEFVRGSGPGGQSVNQTANCVVLKHKPTGIVVKCHETRSLETNRKRARERLQDRVDLFLHQEESFLSQQEREKSLNRQEKKSKNKKRLDLKKAFKDREGLD